ncbi:MAG: permease [Patescibacteria group bacterium]
MSIWYPLEQFADWAAFRVFSLGEATRIGESVRFFIYDTLKIFILLFSIALVMGLVNEYFPVEKVRAYLSTKKLYGADYLLAALFGTITPFCSCSSVPLFIGFVRGGIPLGVTLAFLISSPLVDSVVIAMLLGVFGVKVTLIYVMSGILVAVVAGYLLGKMRLEKYLSSWVTQAVMQEVQGVFIQEGNGFSKKLARAARGTWNIVRSVGVYVIIGVGVGAVIHGFVPIGFFETYLPVNSLIAVPVAVMVAVPLYANAAGILPIAQALVDKGIPLGVVLAFMMAAVGLSFPSAIMLKKAMTCRLIAIFYGTITASIIILGYVYTWIL